MRDRPSAPRPALHASARLLGGRYRLDSRIGAGGVADVYEGVDLRLRRPVAVKVFRPGGDPALGERFADEAVVLAGLQHPGLVTLYDAGRHEDCAYLVMQLVKGTTLARRVSAGPMDPPDVAGLGAGLARALAHVHAAGIVHRDVKPSNVLLDAEGAPHLADFGIARMADATRRTASGELVGTASYLAPEQVLGKEVGPPADVYALGLVLLECLKGETEYRGTPLEAAVARLHRLPAVPRSAPPELARLLRAMTASDPAARPAAGECAETLSALGARLVPAPASGAGLDGAGRPGPDRETAEHGLPAPAVTGPPDVPRRQGGSRPRRLLPAVGTAVLTAVLGAALAAAPDGGETGDGRAAPGSTEPVPTEPSSGPASPGSPRATVRQPAASPSRAPSPASRALTFRASDGGTGRSPSRPAPPAPPSSAAPPSSPAPPSSAGPADEPRERARPRAVRTADDKPRGRTSKSEGRPAGKPRR
ncbi:serine/threonine-protein kinase [Streptomyces glaucus]|uniref:non-specific serine/threonine protein kinase n=1 Tax=Streptomyces glaucus TaxID=284029 RepID=A0ABP5XCH1_9ACTN